jgi:hypothetical protein
MFIIKVHDDGDTEIRWVEEEPAYNTDIVLHSVEDVARELKEYGHDEEAINDALLETGNTPDWVTV